MTDADKIKWLEAWVERLAAASTQASSEAKMYQRWYNDEKSKVKDLESELAAAKEEIRQYSMKPKDNP